MAGPIVVCADGSELSDRAIETALPLLRPTQVVVVTVVEPADPMLVTGTGMAGGMMSPEALDELEQARDHEGRKAVDHAASLVGSDMTVETRVLRGDPGVAICELARDVDASAVVIGSRGRGGIKRALLGSVSDYVVRNAHCPVVVARAEEE
jgi:nucleotide-binding universal stress UspA family protein